MYRVLTRIFRMEDISAIFANFKFNWVVLWTTLSKCVNMQISAAITETSILFIILAIMHYIISKMLSTHGFMVKKSVLCICIYVYGNEDRHYRKKLIFQYLENYA